MIFASIGAAAWAGGERLRALGRAFTTLAMIAFGSAAALAQNSIPASGPFSFLDIADEQARLTYYPDASCLFECPDFRLVCGPFGRIDITLYRFTRDEIVEWMEFTDAPFAGVRAEMRFLIHTDETTTPFVVWNLALADIDTAWLAETLADRRGHAEWLEAFATANEIAVETPLGRLELPSRPQDRANRAAFVEACLAM